MKSLTAQTLLIFSLFACYQTMLAESSKTINRTLTLAEKGNLKIMVDSADVFLLPSENNKVEVIANFTVKTNDLEKAKELYEKINLQMTENDGNVTIVAIQDDKDTSWFQWRREYPDVTLNITVPSERTVSLKSASGDLNISSLSGSYNITSASGDTLIRNFSGELTMISASGDIDAKSLNGPISITSASGDFTASKLKGAIQIKSASGDIEIKDSNLTSIDAKTASGDMRFVLATIPDNHINVKSASGDLEIVFPDAPEASLDLQSMSGSIDVGFDTIKADDNKDRHFMGKSGSGTLPINVKTASGSISIKIK